MGRPPSVWVVGLGSAAAAIRASRAWREFCAAIGLGRPGEPLARWQWAAAAIGSMVKWPASLRFSRRVSESGVGPDCSSGLGQNTEAAPASCGQDAACWQWLESGPNGHRTRGASMFRNFIYGWTCASKIIAPRALCFGSRLQHSACLVCLLAGFLSSECVVCMSIGTLPWRSTAFGGISPASR